MPGPHPAVAATRLAVRRALRSQDRGVLAAVSGGADSLALAAAVAFECDARRPAGLPIRAAAVIVDHGLQDGSAQVAAQAAQTCRDLGLGAEVVRVEVGSVGGGGPEARARAARYAAIEEARRRAGADVVLLGHSRDDQAEQVLLGLARGSGTRSLSGMPPERGAIRRPFLALPRETTRAACEAQGLQVWHDPHNLDPRYRRVRTRLLLAAIEDELPGIGAALARSADLLRDDADALDAVARHLRDRVGESECEVAAVEGEPAAIRRRLWRLLALEHGVPPGDLRAGHLADVDALVADWHGQGPIDLPGGVRVSRLADPPRLVVECDPSRRVR
ncbi:tRNA lysidine(34) synthetase TilS [Mobilicoccus massiliensis]|uniref:tRNA lysidine(34) synthetase TilS n=1 Tax=Mobilicoccus massiliensis TaxID=1522310 RepID=UPI00058B8A3F|nr:tRNA lysidine(34) synthetase TilS [Mobilicoccus massiliensis]